MPIWQFLTNVRDLNGQLFLKPLGDGAVGGLGLIRLALKPAAAGRMGVGNGQAHLRCRPSFITPCLSATGK